MRRHLIILTLIVVACGKTTEQSTEGNETATQVNHLTPAQFADKIKTDVVLIDVRTPEEVARGRIEGSVNRNFQDPSFTQWLDSLDRNQEYAVYCAGGGRSSKVATLMQERGFKEVNNLKGGMKAWKEEGLPVRD